MINLIHFLLFGHKPEWQHYHDYENGEDWCSRCKGNGYKPKFKES